MSKKKLKYFGNSMQLLLYKKITFALSSFICTNKQNKFKKNYEYIICK